MAKRNEFKPDKPRNGLLSKLYLTQKQRRTVLKWFLYALVLLALSVLQDVILSRIRIFGATTELVPVGIFLICILEGLESGSVFALVASALYVFSGTAAGVYCIVLITALSVAVTFFRQSYLQRGFAAAMLCVVAAVIVYEFAVFSIGMVLGLTAWRRVGVFVLTAVYSLVTAPLVYFITEKIGKVGGQTWKE